MIYESKKTQAGLFILPSFVGFAILYLVPFIWGIKYSFSNSGFDSSFVGLRNYYEILSSSAFRLALINTVLFMVVSIPLIMLISFILAISIYELKLPRFTYLFLVLPIAIPSSSVAGFFRKLMGTGPLCLMNSEYALLGVIAIFIWKNSGYNLIIFLSGLLQLDKASIEAAEMDGANYIQKLWHIILPQCTPTTVLVGIVTVINSFKVFKDVYILQGSYPNPRIYMLQHYMNNKFVDLQYEKLTSAAYLFALIIFLFAFILLFADIKYGKKVGEK